MLVVKNPKTRYLVHSLKSYDMIVFSRTVAHDNKSVAHHPKVKETPSVHAHPLVQEAYQTLQSAQLGLFT